MIAILPGGRRRRGQPPPARHRVRARRASSRSSSHRRCRGWPASSSVAETTETRDLDGRGGAAGSGGRRAAAGAHPGRVAAARRGGGRAPPAARGAGRAGRPRRRVDRARPPTTALRVGDEVLVVVPRRSRGEVERRLAAVSEHGRLAGWLEPPTARALRRPVSSAAWRSALASRVRGSPSAVNASPSTRSIGRVVRPSGDDHRARDVLDQQPHLGQVDRAARI